MALIERIGPATLILGDCMDHLDLFRKCYAIVADGPYGIGYEVRARPPRGNLKSLKKTSTERKAPIHGDDQPFDPSHWLFAKKLALFGANYFSTRLPDVASKWVVWDKRDGMTPDDHSDCEMIWLNVPGALRIHRQKWRGVCRAGEENCSRSKKLHPNQKPVALLGRIFDELRLVHGQSVGDPYMGSGSAGVVCVRRGHPFLGAEIDPKHFDTACRRIEGEVKLMEGVIHA